MKFKKLKKCPICDSFNILKISIIKSPIKKINKVFDLMKCKICLHRFISKVPSQIELNKLYEIDSPYMFGGTFQEVEQKNNFINNKFEDIKPQFDHWIFRHLEPIIGKYFELGPGLCRLYRTFFLKGWKCQGLEPRSFIKSNGIKKDINEIENDNDVVVAFDVLEHLVDPIKMLKIINFKIKDQGKIFLTYPHSESFRSKILKDDWPMVSPLSHIHYFSKKSTKIMLEKTGYEIIFIKDFSFVEPRRFIRNLIKMPIILIKDIFQLKFKKIIQRIVEIFLNILDLINGDQLKVIAKKKPRKFLSEGSNFV